MRPLLLCRERLTRLLSILDREGGSCSMRNLWRTYGIMDWEVKQAEDAHWVKISWRKPAVGRPSRLVEKLSEILSAKLPPWRFLIPKEFSWRHRRFALELSSVASCGGHFGFSLSTAVRAYQIAFPDARSRAGAAASASRLRKSPMVKAARRWFLAVDLNTINEKMPETPEAINARISELRKLQALRLLLRRDPPLGLD